MHRWQAGTCGGVSATGPGFESLPAWRHKLVMTKIVCCGEILWDVFKDAEHLGGACFNFAAHSARLGNEVFFISAVGDDERGQRALDKTSELGLSTSYIATLTGQSTGIVTVDVDEEGQPSYVIHRPAAYDFIDLSGESIDQLASQQPDWVCFGTLNQMSFQVKHLTRLLVNANPGARYFYDVNLRVNSYTTELVLELLEQATVVKLNDDEVVEIGKMLDSPSASIQDFCRENAEKFGWEAVCVTQGERGCSLLIGDEFVEAPGVKVKVADAVGAGDAFAAAFVHGYSSSWPAARIAEFANRVGAMVASRHGAIPSFGDRLLNPEIG